MSQSLGDNPQTPQTLQIKSQPEGEVFDLGYRHYDGPRGGRGTAFLALYSDGLRTVMGLGRGVPAKIMPTIFALLALGPALFIVSLTSFVTLFASDPDEIELPGHEDYFQFTFIIMLLFAAIIGPALLSPDRRNSVLALYAVRPLKSLDYSLARWLAFFTFSVAFALIPQALLYLSFLLYDDSPGGYIKDHGRDLASFIGVGLILAAFMTSLAMAAASLTTRRAFASAGVIAFIFITAAVGGFGQEILTSDEDRQKYRQEHEPFKQHDGPQAPDGDAAHYLQLLILPDSVVEGLTGWIFGSRTEFPISPWWNVATISAITGVAFGITGFRYRKFGV
jgi:ABC-2 type transport system permease protein